MFTRLLCALALAIPSVTAASAHDADINSKVTLVYEHALPNVPGKSIKGVLVEYGPGGSSSAHTHPDSAFIYATVLEGAIRSSVNNGPEIVYRPGSPSRKCPATVTASAPTPATPSPRACLPCSSSTPTSRI